MQIIINAAVTWPPPSPKSKPTHLLLNFHLNISKTIHHHCDSLLYNNEVQPSQAIKVFLINPFPWSTVNSYFWDYCFKICKYSSLQILTISLEICANDTWLEWRKHVPETIKTLATAWQNVEHHASEIDASLIRVGETPQGIFWATVRLLVEES